MEGGGSGPVGEVDRGWTRWSCGCIAAPLAAPIPAPPPVPGARCGEAEVKVEVPRWSHSSAPWGATGYWMLATASTGGPCCCSEVSAYATHQG